MKTRFFMPKYNSYTIPISNAMYNEDLPENMKYELLMSSYKDVYRAFNADKEKNNRGEKNWTEL